MNKNLTQDDKGTVITEFALVIPIILLIIFGIIQLLFIVNAKTILQQAAFDAVRSAAVYPDNSSKAVAIAQEQTSVLLKGLGNTSEEPVIVVAPRGSEEVSVKIKIKISLLPFFKQAVMVGGGSGDFELAAKAIAKYEPYKN